MRKATSDKKIVVLYHNDCSDGFSGAWAAWKKFNNKAAYIGVNHNEPPPKGLKGKEIYSVDFTYPKPITKKLMRDNARVTAIDHHISAKDVTLMTYKPLYAINHSGAVLAWKYFHPGKKVPRLLKYVEDGDLWRFALPHTRRVYAYLELKENTFEKWSKAARDLERASIRKQYIEKGKLLLEYEQRMVERLVEKAVKVRFAGYTAYAVNTPIHISKTGHALAQKLPPIAVVWHQVSGKILVSLRSDGTADVSKIAKRYSGGGHKAAAGFTLKSLKDIPWKTLHSS